MKEAINPVPAKPKAPLSNPSTECIKLTVQNYRVEINLLKKKKFFNYKKRFHYHRLEFPNK